MAVTTTLKQLTAAVFHKRDVFSAGEKTGLRKTSVQRIVGEGDTGPAVGRKAGSGPH